MCIRRKEMTILRKKARKRASRPQRESKQTRRSRRRHSRASAALPGGNSASRLGGESVCRGRRGKHHNWVLRTTETHHLEANDPKSRCRGDHAASETCRARILSALSRSWWCLISASLSHRCTVCTSSRGPPSMCVCVCAESPPFMRTQA